MQISQQALMIFVERNETHLKSNNGNAQREVMERLRLLSDVIVNFGIY